MQIIIATDGNLDPETAADLAARLVRDGDTISLATAVEVPRTLLIDLRAFFRTPPPQAHIDEDHEYVGQPTAGTLTSNWPGDDAMIARYVDDQTTKRPKAIKQALTSRGITPVVIARESDTPATTILENGCRDRRGCARHRNPRTGPLRRSARLDGNQAGPVGALHRDPGSLARTCISRI